MSLRRLIDIFTLQAKVVEFRHPENCTRKPVITTPVRLTFPANYAICDMSTNVTKDALFQKNKFATK